MHTNLYKKLILLLLLMVSIQARATQFCNSSPISIPASGPALPYPSVISVGGLPGLVSQVTVTISNLNISNANALDIALVAPDGKCIMLMSDIVSATIPISNALLTFSDAGPMMLSATFPIVTGSYYTENIGAGDIVPTPVTGTNLAHYNTINPNGNWMLFVSNEYISTGSIDGGWCLDITTFLPCSPILGNIAGGNTFATEVNTPFSATITPAGGTGPYSFNPVGALPAGVSLDGSTGVLSGSATFIGNQNYLVRITDNNGCTGDVPLLLEVSAPVTPPTGLCNNNGFLIPGTNTSGISAYYPSPINVTGYSTVITSFTVTLTGLSHTWPSDLDILLVGPSGQTVVLMSDVGSGTDIVNANLTFVSTGASPLSTSAITSGTYLPTDLTDGNPDLYPIAGAGPFGTMNSFAGTTPNGTWKLYILDDQNVDVGKLVSWCIDFYAPCSTITAEINGSGTTYSTEVNVPFNIPIVPNGGTPPYTFSSTNAPEGTNLAPNGDLIGHGVYVGQQNFQVTITDANGCTGQTNFTFNVTPGPTPTGLCSNGGFLIPGSGTIGNAAVYSSDINVTGYSQSILMLSVTLNGLSHTWPSDLDVLLVGPGGQTVVLMSDVGSSTDAINSNLTFIAGGAPLITLPNISGTYMPNDPTPGDVYPSAPAGPYGSLLDFAGTSPNGLWKLYVVDGVGGDVGSLQGWCLNFALACPTISADINGGVTYSSDVNVPLSASITGSGGDAPYAFASSNLPAGVLLDPNGSLSGSVNLAGNYAFQVTATDANGCTGNVVLILDITPGAIPTGLCSNSGFLIPDGGSVGNAGAYPSQINVSGYNGLIGSFSVTLNNLNHTFPGDLDVLLVGPTGQGVVLMSDVGSATDAINNTLTFVASGASPITVANINGSYLPSDPSPGDLYPSAPAGPYGTMSDFAGTSPNGIWQLYVIDDSPVDQGSLGGWCLDFTIACPAISADINGSGTFTTPVNTAFNTTINITGGVGPYLFTPIAALPNGVTLGANGALSGTPTLIGTYNMTFDVTDANGCTSASQVTLEVTAPVIPPSGLCNYNSSLIPAVPFLASSGPAAYYPMPVNVSGYTGNISSISVNLLGLTHTFPTDLDILLVGPAGQKVMLMSDVGGGDDLYGTNLTFVTSSAPSLGLPITSGTYVPTDDNTNGVDALPGVPLPYGSLSDFIGTNPNGVWYLFVYDDTNGDVGQINGWCLNICTVNPVITSNTGTGNFCQGSNLILDAGAGYSSYLWSTGATSRTILVNSSGTFSVTVGDGTGCTGTGSFTTTGFSGTPAVPGTIIGQIAGLCGASGVVYSIAAVPNATSYAWTIPAGATIVGPATGNTITVNYTTIGTGTVSVRAVNPCGQSNARTLGVSGSPAVPGIISGPISGVCNLSNVTYSIAPVPGATSYTWTLPSGAAFASGQGNTSISVNFLNNFNNSGNICVKANNGCGSGPSTCLSVQAKPLAAAITIGPAGVCRNSAGVIYSTPGVFGATSYLWSVANGMSIASGQGTSQISVNFTNKSGNISVKTVNACGNGPSSAVMVRIICRTSGEDLSDEIVAYPNPTSDRLNVQLNLETATEISFRMMDVTGRILNTSVQTLLAGETLQVFDLSSYAKGIYILQVDGDQIDSRSIRVVVE